MYTVYIYINPAYDYNFFLVKIPFWRLGPFWLTTELDILTLGWDLQAGPARKIQLLIATVGANVQI